MIERQHCTIICGVLFLDMVEYSRKPVAQQVTLRERFNHLLREALKTIAPNDRVILDTGDGAAVTFLGDPECALLLALRLRESMAAESRAPEQALSLRCGINLGPVKLVKDINAQPNIIGDGINVAQRIMGFSQPGQILVSRSYFEVVSRLSDDYSNLFRYAGSRTDKHVREHEVYALSGEGPIPTRPTGGSRAGYVGSLGKVGALLATPRRLAERVAQGLHARSLLSTLSAVAAILAVGMIVRSNREVPADPVADLSAPQMQGSGFMLSGYPPPAAGSPEKPVSMPAMTPLSDPVPLPVVPTKAIVEPVPLLVPEVAVKKSLSARRTASKSVAAVDVAPTEDPVASLQPVQEEPLINVSVVALPWGEVYVNGTSFGVSPPLLNVQLRPGQYEIEFRNTTFPSHFETIHVSTDDRLTVRHRFQTGEQR
ncbi:MAG TPA: adenylate/guanylate cyclase domain-containing protein [Burkholderiales bacterium]|jgi:class 3 adenylate cyclase|nr:adenylate/guanylate cyclase domain-containing protein [Burkholderiales bacterium]